MSTMDLAKKIINKSETWTGWERETSGHTFNPRFDDSVRVVNVIGMKTVLRKSLYIVSVRLFVGKKEYSRDKKTFNSKIHPHELELEFVDEMGRHDKRKCFFLSSRESKEAYEALMYLYEEVLKKTKFPENKRNISIEDLTNAL